MSEPLNIKKQHRHETKHGVPNAFEVHRASAPVAESKRSTHSKTSTLSVARSTPSIDHSLSSYFAAMVRGFEGQRAMELRLPSKLVDRLTALYATDNERDDVISMLHSVRYVHYNNAQVAIFGTAGDELLGALIGGQKDWPPDAISKISEFVGHALVWLREPGLNVLKWSASSGQRLKHSLCVSSGRRRVEFDEEPTVRMKVPFTVGGVDGFGGDVSFFNGYASEEMVDWFDTLCPLSFEYFDLDWCFAAFLVLDVVPSSAADEDGHWRRSLDHKLMSALPGNCAMRIIKTLR